MRRLSLLVVTLAFALTSVYAADVKLDGVKCIVAAKNPAKADKTRDYKGGKVYFCCDNCPKEFDKDNAKYASKANAQLAATGQAKQAKCPISGQAVDATKELTVAGAKVQFCCDMCKGKVEKAKDDEKLELVFSDKAFEKAGFKVEKK
jgi:YHS domain-containing protein